MECSPDYAVNTELATDDSISVNFNILNKNDCMTNKTHWKFSAEMMRDYRLT